MHVKDMMDAIDTFCTEDMYLTRVFELMETNGSDFVTVVESFAHPKPLGFITEHDICLHILGKGRNPRGLLAANVMNTRMVKLHSDLTLEEIIPLVARQTAERYFVIDTDGTLCGSLTKRQLDLNTPHKATDAGLFGNRFNETPLLQQEGIH